MQNTNKNAQSSEVVSQSSIADPKFQKNYILLELAKIGTRSTRSSKQKDVSRNYKKYLYQK